MALETFQAFALVNDVFKQVTGNEELKAVDTKSLVAMGEQVFSSNDVTENFTNTLLALIGKTVISFRMYRSKLRPIAYGDLEYGLMMQKIKAEMPEAFEDKAYDLEDGTSVDPWIVMKPKARQKFFFNRTPYSFGVTIQRWQLKRAFRGAAELESFISAIFGEVQNKLELSFESLGYMTMNNYIANADDTKQKIQLVTAYNNITGESISATEALAPTNSAFYRFAIATMNKAARRLEEMTDIFNAEGVMRHTPMSEQRFILIDEFYEGLRTTVQWEAFNREYVEKAADIVISRWQNLKNPMDIMLNAKSGEKTVKNVIGFIHDRMGVGVYRKEQEVLTTPINARGRYYNTFWHIEDMWLNDMSENGIYFTLD